MTEILQFLRDSIWQFIFGLVGLIALVITYLKQRRIKQLSYEVISNIPLVSIEEGFRKEIEIRYRGEIVKDVNLVVMRVVNSGYVEIVPSDYIRPVSFDFGENATIFSVDVVEQEPDNLEAITPSNTSKSKNKVELNPVLFNKGDSVTFKLLGSQLGEIRKPDGRIVGVKEINLHKQRGNFLASPLIATAGITLGAIGILFSVFAIFITVLLVILIWLI